MLESIDRELEGDGMFLINIPDSLNGAYIYRNSLYPATQLFCQSQIDGIDNASFHNILSPSDAVDVTQIAENEYRVQLRSPGTFFMNVHLPFEDRLETQNFTISDVDYTTLQSFTIKIKERIKPNQVAYYSQGQVISLKN